MRVRYQVTEKDNNRARKDGREEVAVLGGQNTAQESHD